MQRRIDVRLRRARVSFLTAGMAALIAVPTSAQSRRPHPSAAFLFKSGNIALSLSGGGAAFTDFQQNPARVIGPSGTIDYTRRISAKTTATMAAALSLWASPSTAFELSGTFTPTQFRVTNQGDGGVDRSAPSEDTTAYARLDLWDIAANMLLRPPISFGRVAPYAIIGAGVHRMHVRDGVVRAPAEAQTPFRTGSRTQAMAVLGAGAVIPLQRRHLLLAFDLTDHLIRTPLSDTGGPVTLSNGPVSIVLRPNGSTEGTDGISLASSIRLTVGLTIPLWVR